LLHLPKILSDDDIVALRAIAARAPWIDGRATARGSAAEKKRNQQVDETTADGRAIAERVMAALQRHPVFTAAAFPLRVSAPLMNRYAPGMEYGPHVDSSLMGRNDPLRTDLSGTLFLSEPGEYDGGELVIDASTGRQAIKLPAGDLFLYPSTRIHFVAPVTRGARLASVFWLQSLVSDHEQRLMLFEMSQALGSLERAHGQSPEIVGLTACYHRLVQMWVQT